MKGQEIDFAYGFKAVKSIVQNVGQKTRGILGEVQLGAILEEILAPEQYLKNVVTKTDMIANKHDTTKMKTMFFLITLVMSLNDISIKMILLPAFTANANAFSQLQ